MGVLADIAQNTDGGSPTAVVTWTEPSPNDNSGSVTLSSNYNSGDAFPIGTTTVIYTATDSSSNKRYRNFDVTITGK